MFMCNGEYFVMYTLFNFEPVKGSKLGVMWECLEVRMTARSSEF